MAMGALRLGGPDSNLDDYVAGHYLNGAQSISVPASTVPMPGLDRSAGATATQVRKVRERWLQSVEHEYQATEPYRASLGVVARRRQVIRGDFRRGS